MRDIIRTILEPVPGLPPLRERMTLDEYEALAMRLEGRIAELEAALRAIFEMPKGEHPAQVDRRTMVQIAGVALAGE